MLGITWISQSACLADLGVDGHRTRICLVADFPLIEGTESLPENVDVILLCGTAVPSFVERRPDRRVRVLASEPVAKMLALVGIIGIERCQLEERIAIDDDLKGVVQVLPFYSGGHLGSCDWVVRVKNVNLFTFCGMRGPQLALPPTTKHMILAAPACYASVEKVLASICNQYSNDNAVIVSIKDTMVLSVLSTLLRQHQQGIFPLSFDALPTWCQTLGAICHRYELVWGRPLKKQPQRQPVQQKPVIALVLESELRLLQSVSGDTPIVKNPFEDIDGWTETDVLQLFHKLRGSQGKVILGPKWVEAKMDVGHLVPMAEGATLILEDETVADKVMEIVDEVFLKKAGGEIKVNGLSISIRDVLAIHMLGSSNFQVECDESVRDEQVDSLRSALERLETRKVQLPGRCNSSRKPFLEKAVVAQVHKQEPSNVNAEVKESTDESRQQSTKQPHDESHHQSKKQRLAPREDIKSYSGISAASSEPKHERPVLTVVEKLKAFILSKGGADRVVPLSDISKCGEFGDKMAVMEIARKNPDVFKVVTEGESKKRSIGLL